MAIVFVSCGVVIICVFVLFGARYRFLIGTWNVSSCGLFLVVTCILLLNKGLIEL